MSKQEQDKKINQVISDAAVTNSSENLSDEDLDKVTGGALTFGREMAKGSSSVVITCVSTGGSGGEATLTNN